jgi:RNA polymerase sigma factor (sigma-70 family)
MPASIKYSENDLVVLLKDKDEKAFSYLYDNYSGALYGVILKVIPEEEAARDILQEAFVKIWRNINGYDKLRGKLFTWMLNIARNCAIDALRSKRYRNDQKIRQLDNNVNLNVAYLSVSQNVDHLGLKTVLASLNEEQRRIIDLAYFKGYTQEEIAREMDMPLGTVKTRVRNALIQLKDILK